MQSCDYYGNWIIIILEFTHKNISQIYFLKIENRPGSTSISMIHLSMLVSFKLNLHLFLNHRAEPVLHQEETNQFRASEEKV